jgi:hypothetical protein
LRVVLDTCILKLATLPGETNYAALIADLVLRGNLRAAAVGADAKSGVERPHLRATLRP